MKWPGFGRAEPAVEFEADLVQWRLVIAKPLPWISRDELLRRLWMAEEQRVEASATSLVIDVEALVPA
ncbi:MAG: hypothetical protein QOH61_2015 [Chloroflexota bacterium]|jgi:hypothetical protein|nr:hypothetical protein [Chloroflexota bacterium]